MKVNLPKYNRGNSPRKITIQIDKWDTYSVDHSLAVIILPLLLQLREKQNGIPGSMCQGVGSDYDNNFCFDFIEDISQEEGEKKWKEILDKMIWSFMQIVDDSWEDLYHHGTFKFEWEPVTITHPITGAQSKAYQMVDHSDNTHWYDRKGHELHNQRINEGLELFGIHFRNLWD